MRPEDRLLAHFGQQEFENIQRQLADFVIRNKLQNCPDICKDLFDYFGRLVEGWNCV